MSYGTPPNLIDIQWFHVDWDSVDDIVSVDVLDIEAVFGQEMNNKSRVIFNVAIYEDLVI